tara:strand:- start:314 stop:1156 length:843 start_codon:yes stop_codon:yes gene_type:complete
MFQINWKLKALLYKIFSVLDLKKIFYLSQKYITKRSAVNILEIDKSWKFHADAVEKYRLKKILEIGAGKSLAQNIYFSYRFNNTIKQKVIDINKMIDFDLINQASDQISKILKIKKKNAVKNITQLKEIFRIDYSAPYKLENLNDTFDICVSTTALEHFSIEDLQKYLGDLKKILTNNGLVSSAIDYSDHYSHTDKKISKLNYLKFTKEKWEKYNNLFLYQNRLRHQDYKKIFKNSGYTTQNIIVGPSLKPPNIINKDFDAANAETFIGWAYFLIKKNID